MLIYDGTMSRYARRAILHWQDELRKEEREEIIL